MLGMNLKRDRQRQGLRNKVRRIGTAVAMLSAAVFSSHGSAAPLVTLMTPSEIVDLQMESIDAMASYTIVDDRLELVVEFIEADGSKLNARVTMVDGQRHTIVLGGSNEGPADARLAFQRVGQSIEVSTQDEGEAAAIASR